MANEKRLIDANALMEQFDDSFKGFVMKRIVEMQPTVDAVEVVHGRWRVSRASEISKTVWCTACGEEIYIHKNDTLKIDRMPYCPNCGAKMDGDGNG